MKKYLFLKDGFEIIKQACDIKIASFLYDYLTLKKEVCVSLFEKKYLAPSETAFGILGDIQCPETFSIYGDVAMDTLLKNLKNKIEDISKLKLYETYSYCRLYKNKDVLKKHKDRFSCEISTTLNLGGNLWPIYIESIDKKEVQISLKQGDMLVYRGNLLEHWREEFKGEACGQVFLHYNKKTKESLKNKFDGRPHLGMPDYFQGTVKHG